MGNKQGGGKKTKKEGAGGAGKGKGKGGSVSKPTGEAKLNFASKDLQQLPKEALSSEALEELFFNGNKLRHLQIYPSQSFVTLIV